MRTFFLEGRFGMFPTALFGFLAVAVALMCALRPDERRLGMARRLAALTLMAGFLGTMLGVGGTLRYVGQVPPEQQLELATLGCAQSLNPLVLGVVLAIVGGVLSLVGRSGAGPPRSEAVEADESLFARLVGGDLRAFDELYRRPARHLHGFIRRELPDLVEAEDVVHDAFLAVLKEGRRHTVTRAFRPWLFQVARHLCLNRARSGRRAAAATDRAQAIAPPEAPHPEAQLSDREESEKLRRALARLPAELSELYALRASGLQYEELAEVLDIPVGTVKSRMHLMVKRLREETQP